MIALMLTGLFFTVAVFAGFAVQSTLQQFGNRAKALRSELASATPARSFAYSVVEHRTLRGDVNVVILPVRKASYRFGQSSGLRAAA